MKTLVIAEKPSVARDIARVLGCSKKENGALEGNKYIVTWALGHLVTLKDPEDYDKKYKEWNMAVLPMMPEKLQIKVIPQTGKQYHAVTTQLARKDVNEIVIATDAGREGELVARWILDKAHNQKPCKRLWISSVTDRAIREGFANLKDAKEYDNLYRAAVSRTTNARCPVCHKRMEMIGKGEDATFVCACGHKERMTKFQERRKKEGGGVTKRDVAAYMKKQKKEAEEPVNNAFAAALKGIKL